MNVKEFCKKNSLKEGTLIEFDYEGNKVKGTIIPTNDSEEIIQIKLSSGYNAGFLTSKIKEIKSLGESKTVGKAKTVEIKKNPNLLNISILHTGGTIASRVDYRTGGVYTSFTPEDLLTMFTELGDIANIQARLLKKMWSDDLRLEHISFIAKEIEKEYKNGAKGIIVGMGTDNLAVGAAGVAFAIENCPIPVIFVGAQRSSDRGSSDAGMNLISAAKFITNTDFAGVAICMHNSTNDDLCAILPACKTRKMHTSRRDAFKAINDTPIATVDYRTGKIIFLKNDYKKRKENEKMIVKPNFEPRVAILKITINMFPEQFEFYTKNKFKGLVIEGTGLGHTPGHTPDEVTKKEGHKEILKAIEEYAKSGVAVMTSQCINGRVNMNVYDKGRDLQSAGVIPGEDMTAEIAMIKLSWLLGNYSPKETKELLSKNLRGEITPFSRTDTYIEE
jgi:glutamyl-tRNA(Gln) amidotransferase subunit D